MTIKRKKKSKSRVNEAGNYTKPAMRKRLFNRIKAGSKGGKQERLKCWLLLIKKQVEVTNHKDVLWH
jgi:hypothetical protein